MKAFLKGCWDVAVRRKRLLVVLNLLVFWSVFAAALLTSFFVVPPLYEEVASEISPFLFKDDWFLTGLGIFLSNLVLSAFIMVTLSGLVFFVLSPVLLLYRAAVWGQLLAFTPPLQFVVALPTLILEAEAYVLAGIAGVDLGLSWLRPRLVYGGEILSRGEALKKAFREVWQVYFFVVLFLLVAAVVETLTLFYIYFKL